MKFIKSSLIFMITLSLSVDVHSRSSHSRSHSGIPCGNGWISSSKVCHEGYSNSSPNENMGKNWNSIEIPHDLMTKVKIIEYSFVKPNEINDSASILHLRGFSCNMEQLISGFHYITWEYVEFTQTKPFAGHNASSLKRKVYYDCVHKKAAILECHFYDSLGIEIPGGGYIPSAKMEDIPQESTMIPIFNSICKDSTSWDENTQEKLAP